MLHFLNVYAYSYKKCNLVGRVKPKAKALRHFKVKVVLKVDDKLSELPNV